MKKSERVLRKCAEWLCYCLSIGWSKSDLDALEKIWWKYHNSLTGELNFRRQLKAKNKIVKIN